jgi:tRNA-dihydrouridine synthase
MEVSSKHTGTTAERKLPSRRLSVAPMMDWTDKSVFMRVSGGLSVISP